MRRYDVTMLHYASRWHQRKTSRDDLPNGYKEGIRAYASRQHLIYTSRRNNAIKLWGALYSPTVNPTPLSTSLTVFPTGSVAGSTPGAGHGLDAENEDDGALYSESDDE